VVETPLVMFRHASPPHVPYGHVLWGPFPARWPILGTSIATLLLGVLFTFLAFHHQRFQCAAETDAMCTVNGAPRFPRASIRRVEVRIERGSKGAKYGVVTFTLEGGATQKLMQIDPDDANVAATEIRDDLARGAPIDVDAREPRFTIAIGAGGLIACVIAAIAGLARMGHYDLIATPDGQTLRVRRSLFGLPLGAREVSLARVTAVIVEWKPLIATPGARGATYPAARLALAYRGGAVERLTEHFFPGNALHYRAALALRNALGLDPDAKDDEALARIPMRATNWMTRLGAAWAGMTTGSLVGMALFGLTMLALGKMHMRDNLDGWFVLASAIPGAIGGIAVVMHATRTRLPR